MQSAQLQDWEIKAAAYVRATMKSRGVTYVMLAAELEKFGVSFTPGSLRSRVSRGRVTAGLFVMILCVCGVRTFSVKDFL